MFLKGRPKPHRDAIVFVCDVAIVEFGRDAIMIGTGEADVLEWPRRSATLAQVGSFDEAHARIHFRRFAVRHVRRGWDVPDFFNGDCIIFARYDCEIDARHALRSVESREFAHRHAVPRGNRVRTDETLVARLNRRPFDRSPNRIRSVENHHWQSDLGTHFHAIQHRGLKRVVSATHILHVDDENIEILQHRARRLQTLECIAVQRIRSVATACVRRNRYQVLRFPAQPVLGAE